MSKNAVKHTDEETALAPITQGTAVALRQSPSNVAIPDDMTADFADVAGAGTENINTDVMLVPEVKVLQKMSPAVDPDDAAYVKGAVPGMFYDNLNNRLFDGKEGITLVPVYYSHHFVEFIPITKGGGFVADHGIDEDHSIRNDCEWNDETASMLRKSNGNQIIETHQFVSMIAGPDGNAFPALVRFTGSKLKCGTKLNSLIKQKHMTLNGKRLPLPAFGAAYHLTTVATENEKGKFYITNIEDKCPTHLISDVGREVFAEGKDLYQGFRAGTTKAQGFEETTAASVGEDKEIPF